MYRSKIRELVKALKRNSSMYNEVAFTLREFISNEERDLRDLACSALLDEKEKPRALVQLGRLEILKSINDYLTYN